MRTSFLWTLVPVVVGLENGVSAAIAAGIAVDAQGNVSLPTTEAPDPLLKQAAEADAEDEVLSEDIASCCSRLSSALPNRVVNRIDLLEFQARQNEYWDNQQRAVRPACFVVPENANEVATAMKILTGQGAAAAAPAPAGSQSPSRAPPSPSPSPSPSSSNGWGSGASPRPTSAGTAWGTNGWTTSAVAAGPTTLWTSAANGWASTTTNGWGSPSPRPNVAAPVRNDRGSRFRDSLGKWWQRLGGARSPFEIKAVTPAEQAQYDAELAADEAVASPAPLKPKQKRQSTGMCKFAIKSGGHSPIVEWSSIQDGITLDLGNLGGVTVAADRKSVDIGPGNRWASVYDTLSPQNLGTSGGRVASVGVGGLVTGGGISFFSRERGLVCDNVQEFEVVLADGRIVLANAAENSDLYRALKGGSGNFGIVTRIKMGTFEFPQGRMWGGTAFHKTTDAARSKLLGYFQNITSSTTDVHVAWIHSYSFVNAVILKLWVSTSNIHYTLPVENPAPFQPVLASDVTDSNDAGIKTLSALTEELAELNGGTKRQLFATLTFKNSAAFMETFYQISKSVVATVENTVGLSWTISYQSLPYDSYSQGLARGDNALGLDSEKDDLIVALLTATWDLSTSDNNIYTAARSLFTQAQTAAATAGVAVNFKYLNYADKWQNPIGGYGPSAVSFLKGVAAKYDPNGVFQKQVPGGFKIPA